MAEVKLPSGDTAVIMEIEELTAGVKLAAQRAVQMTLQNGKMVLSLALNEEMKIASLAVLIKSWSKPVPVTAKEIERLGIKDYNALTEAVKGHLKELRTTPDKSDSAED